MFMKKITKKSVHYFQDKILSWFEENGRTFPWRKAGISNYKKVIAEVLLQRTKAETISQFYPIFLKKYPTWNSIDKSRLKTLEKALKPIGLYSQRSMLLKKLAKEMIKRNGRLPRNKEEIEKLPFAGQYITNAILQFVFNDPAPLLDVNMSRVLERFFGARDLSDIRYDPYLQRLAWSVIKHDKSKMINREISDFAARVCKNNKPLCRECEISNRCTFFKFRVSH